MKTLPPTERIISLRLANALTGAPLHGLAQSPRTEDLMTPFETWRQAHVTQLIGDFEDSITKALTEAYLHGCHDGHAKGYLEGVRDAQEKAAQRTQPTHVPLYVHCYRKKGLTCCGLTVSEHEELAMTGYLGDITCQACFNAMRSMV